MDRKCAVNSSINCSEKHESVVGDRITIMDAFVTRNSKVGDSVPAAKKTANPPKSQPKRKYDNEYLALGFTVRPWEQRTDPCIVS